jgi:NADPH:quinone reductase
MKAIIVSEFGSADVLKYVDMDLPILKASDVLVRVEKTSVNYADVKTRYGNKGGGKLPFIPGLDAAGVIEKVGQDVQHLQVGQRVVCFPSSGSYAEYAVADERLVFPIPDELEMEVAAACPTVSFLSYKLLADIARMEKGERVLIHSAAGGVGTTAIQIAKLLGAGLVIGTVGSEEKMAAALEAGADYVICYEKEDFAQKVNGITNGHGVNIILDSLAGTFTEKSFECLAPYGRLVQFGNSSGKAGGVKTTDLHASCRSVLGYSLGTTRKLRPETLKETAQHVFHFLANGQLKIHIGHQFSLEEAADAHRLIESRKSTGKILLNVL